jgi:hypothetical protein
VRLRPATEHVFTPEGPWGPRSTPGRPRAAGPRLAPLERKAMSDKSTLSVKGKSYVKRFFLTSMTMVPMIKMSTKIDGNRPAGVHINTARCPLSAFFLR